MKNGYNRVELAIVLGLFSIVYFSVSFVLANKFSVDFENDYYEHKIKNIENGAVLYAKLNEELFSESNTVYITVDDLVKTNAIYYSSDGEVLDPRGNDNSLNNVKVKITNKNNDVVAKILT